MTKGFVIFAVFFQTQGGACASLKNTTFFHFAYLPLTNDYFTNNNLSTAHKKSLSQHTPDMPKQAKTQYNLSFPDHSQGRKGATRQAPAGCRSNRPHVVSPQKAALFKIGGEPLGEPAGVCKKSSNPQRHTRPPPRLCRPCLLKSQFL